MCNIRLAIVDDHLLFRKGLISLLSYYPNFSVKIEATDGSDLLQQLRRKEVDVVLLDLQMPVMDGFATAAELQIHFPEVKIIILSMNVINEQVRCLIDLGVSGYLLKNQEIDSVIEAIETVYGNNYYFNDLVSFQMVQELMEDKKIQPICESVCLSEREIEVIQLICAEYTNKEISEHLNISPRTVEGHRERILQKTNAKNVVGIVMYAVKNKLLHKEMSKSTHKPELIR